MFLFMILFTIILTTQEKMSEIRIVKILKNKKNVGLSITELVYISQLSRSAVRTMLAKLEGAGKVSFRKVGMAKLYYLKES